MHKQKHIHFVGIKGVGMTPLAILAQEAGFKVTGCDIADTFITDFSLNKAGITPLINFSPHHIKDIDLVITTGAHGGVDNSEVVFAKKNNIPVMTQGEAVGKFMEGEIYAKEKSRGISVAGCHGKTTTTSMIATIFTQLKYDPSYVIGTSSMSSTYLPGHFGTGDYFIAEADEYATDPQHDKSAKMLWQHPEIAIITNVEFDHPDIYKNIGKVREAYVAFINNMGNEGKIIVCGDDRNIQKIQKICKRHMITYGFSSKNEYRIKKVRISGKQTFFTLFHEEKPLGECVLQVPGDHNALNAAAAIITSLNCGMSFEQITKALYTFTGTRRRFEYIKSLSSGALLFDDYAHHPTEIITTLKALHQAYPDRKIICIFQPHTYSRTKLLFEQFIVSFGAAETVVIANIYSSKREKIDETVSGKLLAERIYAVTNNAIFLPTLPDVVKYLNEKKFDKEYLIISMGAGDIYQIADLLI